MQGKNGGIIGPLDPSCHPLVHIGRFGVIPKSTLGKWRLLVDMLSPEDGRDTGAMVFMLYATVTDAAFGIAAYGREAMLVKP